jgi:hypothetical protein
MHFFQFTKKLLFMLVSSFFEDVDDCGASAAADVVRQADSRAVHLPRSGLPAQLRHDFRDLRDSRSAYWVAFRLESAARVDADFASEGGAPRFRRGPALPFLKEA